jgi:hypothetical protein
MLYLYNQKSLSRFHKQHNFTAYKVLEIILLQIAFNIVDFNIKCHTKKGERRPSG